MEEGEDKLSEIGEDGKGVRRLCKARGIVEDMRKESVGGGEWTWTGSQDNIEIEVLLEDMRKESTIPFMSATILQKHTFLSVKIKLVRLIWFETWETS